MCLEKMVLVSSHLMPAALYDYCRKGEHGPIKVGGGFVIPTDRQTQDYLLCQNCEDVLNKGGEQWIANKLATWERTFPLYDLLTKVPPEFDEDGMVVYLAALLYGNGNGCAKRPTFDWSVEARQFVTDHSVCLEGMPALGGSELRV